MICEDREAGVVTHSPGRGTSHKGDGHGSNVRMEVCSSDLSNIAKAPMRTGTGPKEGTGRQGLGSHVIVCPPSVDMATPSLIYTHMLQAAYPRFWSLNMAQLCVYSHSFP